MKFCKTVFLLLILFISAAANGQSVLISGSGSGYQNAEVRFYSQTDPVTKGLRPIMKVSCDEKGAFTAEVPCRKPEIIFIKVGTFNFHLYVTENSRYILLLPNNIAKSGSEEMNPFFIETELMPEVVNDKQDVNNLIRDFDAEYNPVFNFTADRVFRNTKNDDIKKEISKLDKYPVVQGKPFYSDYVKCRMIMLNLVFSSGKNDQIKSAEFINAGFNPGNPAYSDLAEQMFSGYFNKLSAGPLKASFDRAIAIASYSELRSVILEDGVITNKELADYVLLINLNSDYYERNLPGDNVRKIISLMKSQGETLFIKDVASIMLGKINSTLPGNLFAGFSLSNSDGKLISLPDFRGKYLLLGFARSDSPVSQSELGIINMWYKKYTKDLQVVTILADKQFKTASELMKKRGFNWICLDGSDRDNIEFKYDLKMYPTFILLDREGKIIASPSSYPSEDLEFVINKIIQAGQAASATENR